MSPHRKKSAREKLAGARAVVIGAGGLGSPVSLSLAAAGIGSLRIVDDDLVELGNLQRQTLFRARDVGRPKVEAAAERLRAVAPGLDVEAVKVRVDAANAWDLVEDADVVVDGSDNFPTRFLINDACVLTEVKLVTGGVRQWLGQVLTVWAGRSPCYRCIFEDLPADGEVPSCAEAGVLGALVGAIGALQASEAIRLLTGESARYQGRLLTLEAQSGRMRTAEITERNDCAVCGDAATIRTLDATRYVPAACAPTKLSAESAR